MTPETPAPVSFDAILAAGSALNGASTALLARERLTTLGEVTVELRRVGQKDVKSSFGDITGAMLHVMAEMRRGSMLRDLGAEMVVSVRLATRKRNARRVLMHRRLAVVDGRLTWGGVDGGSR